MSTPAGLADMAPLKRSIHRRKARNVASSPAVTAGPRSGARTGRVVPFPTPENAEKIDPPALAAEPVAVVASAAEPVARLESAPPALVVEAAPMTPVESPIDEHAPAVAPELSTSEPSETPSTLNMAKELTAEPSYSATAPRPAVASDRASTGPAGAPPSPTAGAPAPASPRSMMREAEEKLSLLRDNREIFEWILEKQSSLRTEFVGFLKKDLREIDYVVSDITTQGDKGDFAANALELIKNTYIKHWERSFELISPENVLQRTREE